MTSRSDDTGMIVFLANHPQKAFVRPSCSMSVFRATWVRSKKSTNMIWLGWFGTFFIFPHVGNNHPNWLIFFREVETTNQWCFCICLFRYQSVVVSVSSCKEPKNMYMFWSVMTCEVRDILEGSLAGERRQAGILWHLMDLKMYRCSEKLYCCKLEYIGIIVSWKKEVFSVGLCGAWFHGFLGASRGFAAADSGRPVIENVHG